MWPRIAACTVMALCSMPPRERNAGSHIDTPNDTFGRHGNMGIFTICPTVKPKGGFFTRPEFRAFATYAVWSKSLEGSIGGTQYQNNRMGWVFGVQTEWFF